VKDFGSFESTTSASSRDDGAMDLYHGNLRAIDAKGETIFDQVDYQKYLDYIVEEVRPGRT
jgi:NAD-reducing hydrogenase large subunit